MATSKGQTTLLIHPGEYIAEELEARGMSQRELARNLGRPYQAINDIVRRRKAVQAETALGLERVWDVSAETWLNLQTAYDLARARQRSAG